MIVVNIVIGQDLLACCRLLFDDHDGDALALQRALNELGPTCNVVDDVQPIAIHILSAWRGVLSVRRRSPMM